MHRHFQRNKHHWQWWIWNKDDGSIKVFPMSSRYRREMLADMRGAGKAQKKQNTLESYYCANKNKMVLHSETRKWLEDQLDIERLKMQNVICSNELMPYIAKALGLEEHLVQSITLYLEHDELVRVTVDMLGTENLKNVQWKPIEKLHFETRIMPENEDLADGTY